MGETEGSHIEQESQENLIVNPWETMPHTDFEKQMGDLNTLLDSKNHKDVLKAVKNDPRLLRTAILEKGENLSHLESIQEAADILLVEKYGSEVNIDNVTAEQISTLSNEVGLPHSFWTQISEAAFHGNNEKLFMHLSIEYKNAFQDNTFIQDIAEHDMASWIGSRGNKKPEDAFQRNKLVLNKERQTEIDPVLKQKILFGIRIYRFQSEPNKKKLKDAPDGIIKIAEKMKELDMPEVSRAYEEAAKMALELENIDQAEEYLNLGIEIASNSNYPNAILGLEKTYAQMLKAKGDYRGSRKYFTQATETSKELGGHYREETTKEVSAELKEQFPCQVLIEIEGQGFLVKQNKDRQYELPEISLKTPKDKKRKMGIDQAKENQLKNSVQELLFDKKRPEKKKKGKKKPKSQLAGSKIDFKKPASIELDKNTTVKLELAHITMPEGRIFDSTLTELKNNGYTIISGEELEASKALEEF